MISLDREAPAPMFSISLLACALVSDLHEVNSLLKWLEDVSWERTPLASPCVVPSTTLSLEDNYGVLIFPDKLGVLIFIDSDRVVYLTSLILLSSTLALEDNYTDLP